MKKLGLFVLILLIACASAMPAHADLSKLSPDLQKYSGASARVVVQYYNPPSLLSLQGITKLVGSLVMQLPLINAIVADLPLADILSLSDQAEVKYISLDRSEE